MVINPLNWKTDETPESREETSWSFVVYENSTYSIVPGLNDATINLILVLFLCTTAEDYTVIGTLFGDTSLHNGDFDLYFSSVLENMKTRIATLTKK